MAFDVKTVNGLGTGALGDLTISSSSTQVNSYANVTAVGAVGYQLTIGTPSVGAFGGFTVGQEILFHSTCCLGTETTNMGAFGYATILAVNGSTLSLDKKIPIIDLAKYVCQVVTVPNFNNLTINCAVSALAYSVTNKHGGILVAKAKGNFNLAAGQWLTENKGLPKDSSLKPAGITMQNADLINHLVMSTGNGIALIVTNNLIVSSACRIGASWTGAGTGGVGGAPSGDGGNGGAGYGGGGGSRWGASAYGNPGSIGVGGNGCNGKLGGNAGYNGALGENGGGEAGAVVAIFANIISGFDISCFSTGGKGGACGNSTGYGSGGGGAGFGYIATNSLIGTNAVAYALDTIAMDKTGLLISDQPLDCTDLTSVDGCTIEGQQPSGSNRRVIFSTNTAVVLGSRTFPITTNAVAADTVTIGGVTFTAIASGATGNQFNVGATIAVTATNLATVLNANATINALYTATADSNGIITLTEKIAKGNTPSAATKTGTIVIGAGTPVASVPKWYKLTIASGTATLSAVATQTPTISSVLSEGNTVDELLTVTSIAAFVGKMVYPAIALMAPYDATVLPTLKLTLNGKSNTNQTTLSVVSLPISLASEEVELVDLSASVAVTDGAAATVSVSLQQNGSFGDYMPLTTARRQKATAIKFKADYSVASIGTGSATVNKASATYRTNNSAVSGDVAEMVTVTEDFGGVGMRAGRMTVKHQVLRDAQISAQMAMRPVPKTRERIPIATGTGNRQTVVLGVKDANGNVVADTGINHNTLRVWYGSQEVFDFDYNTQLSQASVTPPDGVTAFASYSYGWEPETWVEMTKGTTQTHDDPNVVTTEFSYALGSADAAKGVAAAKVLLKKPTGSASQSLGTATGKTQMFVLDHLAKLSALAVTASTGTASWSYDEDSRILTVAATKDAALTATYDWVAETPVCTGFVAAWNE